MDPFITSFNKATRMPKRFSQAFLSVFNTARHIHNQPKTKQMPPRGVTGPKNVSQSAPNK
jgi:hypothetical protein